MQLNELVRSWLPEGGTVVDRTGSEHAWPPLMEVADVPTKDALIAVTADGDLSETAPGDVVLLLLPWAPHELPVGSLIQKLVTAGLQATEAHPLADTAWGAAVICRRVDDEVGELHAYLDRSRTSGPLTGRTLLRLVDEHIVEGLVWRTQEQQLAAVTAERDALREERAALKKLLSDDLG
ncbi:hypothetical protein ACFTSF_23010 [Kribbella sp. NPDC056951]|uniref:hypothetical protein n=1 Tax=Kribbella sp. NPDC056951 TaxID=3345978 RepID=UPI00363FA35E